MKNLIIILLSVFALSMSAQDKVGSLSLSNYFDDFTFNSGDSIYSADSVYQVQVNLNKPEPVKYDIFVSLDSISGSDSVYVRLKGKRFAEESYTQLDSVAWYQSSTDTNFVFSEQSTAKYYRILLIDFEGGENGTQAVEDLKVKIWSK